MSDITDARCLLCGEPLDRAAVEGETLSPLVCGKDDPDHAIARCRAFGMLGFYLSPEEASTPAAEITARIRGRRIVEAWHTRSTGLVLVLALDNADLLVVFHCFDREAYVQFVPSALVAGAALLTMPTVTETTPRVGPIRGAITRGSTIRDLVRDPDAKAWDTTLHLRFADGSVLEAISDGPDFYGDTRTEFYLSWRA